MSAAESGRPGLRVAGSAGVLLLATLAAVIAVTTPWHALAGVHADTPTRDFTAAQIHTATTYVNGVRPPAIAALLLAAVVAAVLGYTRLGARLSPPVRPAWLRSGVTAALIVLVIDVIVLPLRARAEQVDRQQHISTTTWPVWLRLEVEGWLVQAVVTAVVIALLQLAVRRLPRWWWAAFAAGGAGLVAVGSLALPVAIEPLYAHITPLAAGPLRDSLLAMARRDGVHLRQIYVTEPIATSTVENAYVEGLGPTKRIVLYRSLLDHSPPDQVRVVLAHELGHWTHHDLERGTVEGALAIAAAACLAPVLLGSAWVRRRSGSDGPGDPRGVALLLGSYAVVALLATPAYDTVSRHVEANADRHALNLSADPRAFAGNEVALTLSAHGQPRPPTLLHLLLGDHPTPVQRIALARQYAAVHHLAAP